MPAFPEIVQLLTVDVQANNDRLKEIAKDLELNKGAVKALNEAFKAGRIDADAYAEGQVRLKAAAANLSQEARVLTKANQDQAKATDAAKGSIEQLRAQLALGTAAYNKMSAAERDNTEAGQKLQANNKALSDQLKGLEGAIGDTRRNVGNYKEAILGAAKESGLFGDLTDRVTGLQNKFILAQELARKALGGTAAASNTLKVSLLAIPLFAIIAAFGALYSFLTSTQEGMDFLARKTAGLGAVLSVVTNAVNTFGGKLFAAASNPKQAFLELLEFLGNNVANRFKAFGVLLDAVRNRDLGKLADGVIQLSTGIADGTSKARALVNGLTDVAKAGEAIEAETQRIGNVERALNLERDRSRAKIEALKKLADDTTKSAAARAAAARQAGEMESRLLSEQLALQDAKIANLRAEQTLKKNNSDADRDALNALLSERAHLAQESLKIQTNLQNKVNAINEAARAKEDARMAAQIDREIAEADARIERADKLRDSEDKGRAVAKAREDAARAEKLAKDKAAYDVDIRMLERNLDERRITLESSYAKGEISKEQYEKRLYIIEEGGFAGRILLAKQHNQDVSALEKAHTRAHNAELLKQTTAEQAAYRQKLAVAQAFGTAIGQTFADTVAETGATLEDFATRALILVLDEAEKFILAQEAKNLARAIAAGGYLGIIEAAGESALIAATFEIAKAALRKPAKFATGGIVEGPGTGTSDSIPAQLSNGESVINAQSTAQFRPLLSYLNQLGGGVAFSNQAPSLPRSMDGGLMARSLGGGGIDYAQLAQACASIPVFTRPSETAHLAAARAQRIAKFSL